MSLKRFEKQAGMTVLKWIGVTRFRSCDRDLTASTACPVVSVGISTIKRASSDTGEMVVASAKSGYSLYKENRTFGKNTKLATLFEDSCFAGGSKLLCESPYKVRN